MCDQEQGLSDRRIPDYFVVSLRYYGPWFADRLEYWERHFDYEMGMGMNRGLTKTYVGWHNGEVFAHPPRNRAVLYELVSGLRVGWEPSGLLLVLSPFVFADYSGLMVCGSEDDKPHIWGTAIT